MQAAPQAAQPGVTPTPGVVMWQPRLLKPWSRLGCQGQGHARITESPTWAPGRGAPPRCFWPAARRRWRPPPPAPAIGQRWPPARWAAGRPGGAAREAQLSSLRWARARERRQGMGARPAAAPPTRQMLNTSSSSLAPGCAPPAPRARALPAGPPAGRWWPPARRPPPLRARTRPTRQRAAPTAAARSSLSG